MTDYPPTSQFILKRIIKHDMEGTPGWALNHEMRQKFTEMLQEYRQQERWGRE